MENLKVKVNGKKDGDSAQELFFKLGYGFDGCKIKAIQNLEYTSDYYFFAYAHDMDLTHSCDYGVFMNKAHKEITLQELRDMVVLKRNNPKDANVYQDGDISCLYDLYLTGNKELYFYHCGKKAWILSNLNHDKDYYELLKPIKEEVMKEFLNPEQNYSLVGCCVGETPIPESWIEIPEGANFYCDKYFWMQLNSQKYWNGDNWQNDEKTLCNFSKSFDIPILWQREKESTIQEKLDYIDELRSMGESGWSKEKHSHYKKDVSHLNVIDPYRIADLYALHPCADHIMKKSLCAGNRGHKDTLQDIQDIIDTAERWKQMIEEDNNEI